MQECTTKVIGIGSPHGDDQSGWVAVARAENRLPSHASAILVREVAEVLDHLEGCDRVVLVDAVSTGSPPGTVRRFRWPDERLMLQQLPSTHGVGLADVLLLAEELDRLPKSVILIGIELEQTAPCAELSHAVEEHLDTLVTQLLRTVA